MKNSVDPSAAASAGLSKSLGSRHIAMIAMGGVIGAGLFVGSSVAIVHTGPAAILSYLLAGGIIILVMRMLGEMAVAVPGRGSFTEYVRIGLGDRVGFICGWLYWYFWIVVVAIEAIAGANLLKPWINLPVWQTGLILQAALTAVNLFSSRSYGEFEFWFASIKVGAILLFIVAALGYACGLGSGAGPTFTNLARPDGFMPFGFGSVLAGVTTVIFALCGAEIASIAAAESKEPARAVARMGGTVSVRILVFYVLSIFCVVAVVPWRNIQSGFSPFTATLAQMGVPGAATIMNLIVLTAVLSCLNSGLYVASRVLFSLAGRGEAPAGLTALNSGRVPARAVWLSSLLAYGAVLTSIVSPTGVFAFLVNASGATMLFIYLLLACA
jgi:L-asparagine transporter-like permease